MLKTKKEEINEVIEASQEAHEQREEAKHKTIMLRSRAEKDLQQYDTDIKEEERSAENDFQLKEFMEVKNQEREERSEKFSRFINSVKPFISKNRDKIYVEARNQNLKKGCGRDFRATT